MSRPDMDLYQHPPGLADRLIGKRLYQLDIDSADGRTHARGHLFFADPEDLDKPAPPTPLPTRPFVAARAARWLAAVLADRGLDPSAFGGSLYDGAGTFIGPIDVDAATVAEVGAALRPVPQPLPKPANDDQREARDRLHLSTFAHNLHVDLADVADAGVPVPPDVHAAVALLNTWARQVAAQVEAELSGGGTG